MSGPLPALATADPSLTTAVVGIAPDDVVVAMIQGIARGESGALAVFYESWFDRAFDMARGLTRRDESFCLDVVQEAMMKVIRKLNPSLGIVTRASLDAWFTRVVHTTAIDALRREARRCQRESVRAQRGGVRGTEERSALEMAAIAERVEWVAAELGRLDEVDGSLMTMRFGQGRSIEAVGAQHNMSHGATHGRIRRLLDRLRRTGKDGSDE